MPEGASVGSWPGGFGNVAPSMIPASEITANLAAPTGTSMGRQSSRTAERDTSGERTPRVQVGGHTEAGVLNAVSVDTAKCDRFFGSFDAGSRACAQINDSQFGRIEDLTHSSRPECTAFSVACL